LCPTGRYAWATPTACLAAQGVPRQSPVHGRWRSRDILSLAPFRLLVFAGATLIVTSEGWNIRSTRRVKHPCFANARFAYLCNPMQQKGFFAVESLMNYRNNKSRCHDRHLLFNSRINLFYGLILQVLVQIRIF
jgi:hypothetical protein